MTSSSCFVDDRDHPPRGNPDALLETVCEISDPEGLITKFVAYESFRIKREQHVFDMVGGLQDRLNVLFWYLGDYVRDRQNAFAVPLSARQVGFLNRPAPIAGASAAVTVALHNFVARELPTHLDLRDPAVLREALYWWCVEKAPRCRFETRLVTDEQVAALRVEEQWIGEAYPFNAFMTQFFNRHQELHALEMASSRDRAAFVHYLILHAFTQPHLLRLLPTDVLRRALRGTREDTNLFDRVIGKLAVGADATADSGRHLREAATELIRHARWRLDGTFVEEIGRNTSDGRSAPSAGDSLESGVALIGPIRKASGLGQATRLSYHVLRQLEAAETVTVLDFDLDNPAPLISDPTRIDPLRVPRAINLIHLNAESIPLVFASEQRKFVEASYNIGYFFWELNEIPKCHKLALELIDEIWVSSDYNREIYSRFTDKPVVNVGMAVEPLPKIERPARESLGLDPESVVFLATFDSFSFIERKNPLGILDAFKTAFPLGTENVQLVLKTQNRGRVFDPYQLTLWKRIDQAVRADRRIVVINQTLDYPDLLGLKSACDCYVSLHRSEGWGFGMIEAMQLGLPVIATAYSGNMEFCSDETAYLVDYDLISVREEEYIFVERGSHWAQPRIATAADHMRGVLLDPAATKAKGNAAALFVRERFGIDAIAKRYGARLADLKRLAPIRAVRESA